MGLSAAKFAMLVLNATDSPKSSCSIDWADLEKPCIIQLFLGRYLIDIYEKLHSSPQNSKTRAGAGLEDINMDQSETW